MNSPRLSIIIPTHNRPHLLPIAVKSALEQTIAEIEVIVVDDASTQKADLPADPRLRVITLSTSRGGAGARNVGTEAANAPWITYLDDDDRLFPDMAAVSLAALQETTLPAPVAVISGIDLVNAQGQRIETRLPPPMRSRGAHFALEELEAGHSYNTKQTMVVEKSVIQQIGGWDESFRSRVHSELFLRLNQACSIIGLPTVTYQLWNHMGDRVSSNLSLRQESFQRLVNKHRALFEAHPQRFTDFVYDYALTLYRAKQKRAAFINFCWALQISPRQALGRFGYSCSQTVHSAILQPTGSLRL